MTIKQLRVLQVRLSDTKKAITKMIDTALVHGYTDSSRILLAELIEQQFSYETILTGNARVYDATRYQVRFSLA